MATNEGTCGYNKDATTGEKLTTPGGIDKRTVREAIESVLERKGKTSRNRKKKKKAKKRDRCLRIADRKFDKPSAYKSGAVVRCRKGDIWKGVKEEQIRETLENLLEKKIKLVVEKKVKNVLNTPHVNPLLLNAKIQAKVNLGVKKLLNQNNK